MCSSIEDGTMRTVDRSENKGELGGDGGESDHNASFRTVRTIPGTVGGAFLNHNTLT